MTLQESLVAREVDAVGPVVRDVAFDPLNVRTRFPHGGVGFFRGGLQLLPARAADSRQFSFDQEFTHGASRFGRPLGL